MTGQQRINAPIDRTWVALNDPGVLKECIAGCDSIERTADDEYALGMNVRIGPVNARFKGKLRLENIVPPTGYSILFDGQGGVAGFGKGKADVKLSADAGETVLDYAVNAQVGGKIAQIGSRLVDAAAKKMADDFFVAFNAKVGAPPPAEEEVAPTAVPMAVGAAPAFKAPMWVWWIAALVAAALIILFIN